MQSVKKITLKNGLRILLVPQPDQRAATVLILVAAGSEYETKATNGVSHFLEHLTFKGTTNRPKPGMIAEELAALGARSNAFTSREYTGYWAKSEAHKLPKILEIVSDLYLHPMFDPAEIEKERGVVIQEINMDEDDLPSRVYKNFISLLYGNQPAGWDIAGPKQNIRKLTRKDFADYRAERYVMSGTVIAIAGKINEKNYSRSDKKIFWRTQAWRRSPKKENKKSVFGNARFAPTQRI